MNWDFFDFFGFIGDVLNVLSGSSSSSKVSYDDKHTKRKTKYLTEKISVISLLISTVLLFFVFKTPLPSENYVQTIVVASLIGLATSMLVFFILYVLGKYYFKSIFQWLFFSFSMILFFVSLIFYIYFKSGIFI
ncbi:branched-chain amino acid ABC transporter substrate-binding protein [Chryseobacterium oryctis]|uniref:Branched-chain amino acid ABC transporter substrate-binding protein n=1 Tax=Chryseobacterium oryctis TaxID=2952618 RepID=A0ABT3HN59_9FLAO|nr:branched-chain amino acid ABC transporter substrate-binding protein [Chryseobacterium oryctis]MCW3161194.1 branched-chain amino acid ABC transporter substrate-binding protein [Chryseobacterium oryctis]